MITKKIFLLLLIAYSPIFLMSAISAYKHIHVDVADVPSVGDVAVWNSGVTHEYKNFEELAVLGGYQLTKLKVVTNWGAVSASGVASNLNGISSIVRVGVGVYNVTLSSPLQGTEYKPSILLDKPDFDDIEHYVTNKTTTSFTLSLRHQDNGQAQGNPIDKGSQIEIHQIRKILIEP